MQRPRAAFLPQQSVFAQTVSSSGEGSVGSMGSGGAALGDAPEKILRRVFRFFVLFNSSLLCASL